MSLRAFPLTFSSKKEKEKDQNTDQFGCRKIQTKVNYLMINFFSPSDSLVTT